MRVEDDIKAFQNWAISLSCRPEDLPSEEALKSVFKSRQRDLFCNLMRYVRPRQEVQHIKENILMHKAEKIKDHLMLMPAYERALLPLPLQNYVKLNDLKKEEKKISENLEMVKKEYETLSASIKNRNIKIINLEHKCHVRESKVQALEFKCDSWKKELEKEQKNKETLLAAQPVTITPDNSSESKALETVQQALRKLQTFYEFCEQNNNAQVLSEAKEKLWSDMRHILKNTPNVMIFNTLLRLQQQQLQHIIQLSKTDPNDSITGSGPKDTYSEFDLNLLETKANFLVLVAKYLRARQERQNLEKHFLNIYAEFENKLLDKVKLFNATFNEEKSKRIIEEFVLQYNLRNFTRGQNDFLQQQIELLRAEIETSQQELQNHDLLLSSTKELYSKISRSVNRLNYEICQLPQINDKIIYSKNVMESKLNDLESSITTKMNFMPAKMRGNSSNNNNNMLVLSCASGGGGVDIFETSQDNVFCSTKLDFDASVANISLQRSFNITGNRGGSSGGNDMTINPTAQMGVKPSHTLELQTFHELPLEYFSCIPKECQFYLAANPLVVESNELSSTLQLAPGILLTPFGALQEVRKRIAWADLIAQHTNNLKLNLNTFIVDESTLKLKVRQQHECISELLDNITVTSVHTQRLLQTINKLYAFLIENPLRHYIPPTKTYNNRTYNDYESEFMTYYRMTNATNSNSSNSTHTGTVDGNAMK